MATKKQLQALEKARKAKKHKGLGGILSGFGLANPMSISKNQAYEMLKDGAAIFIGFAAGKIGGQIVKKHIVKDATDWKRFVEPAIQIGGGMLISATGRNNRFISMMGKGVMSTGIITAIETATKKSLLELVGMNDGTSGLSALGKAIQDIEEIEFKAELPELQGAEEVLLGEESEALESANEFDMSKMR